MADPPPDIPLPPWAYVPGKTDRHPEDWFDPIKASVTPDIPPGALHETAAFQAGLIYLKAGYFWECHEVLEAVWMQTPETSAEREAVQALIQLANARLKRCMGRPRAAARLHAMVQSHLDRLGGFEMILGLQPSWLQAQLDHAISEL